MLLAPLRQESIFTQNNSSAWRPFERNEDESGPGVLSVLGRIRGEAASNRAGIATALRDRFEYGNTIPTYGPGGVIENLQAYRGNPEGRRALVTAAGLYADATPGLVNEGTLFFGDTTVTSTFGALADTLAASIRDNATPADGTNDPEAIQRAATLYRLTSQGITGGAGLLPSPALFITEPPSSYDVFALPPSADTAASLIDTFAGETGGTLADVANLYLATGYRLYQTPRLLIDLFA